MEGARFADAADPAEDAGRARPDAGRSGAGSENRELDLDLGGHREGHPERLDRAAHGATLIEAEHLGRYRWVSPLAPGRRVLDAGCGTAYGTAILASAGASEAVGVDRDAEVLEAVRGRMPDSATLTAADLLALPLQGGSFDLVVCFEALEHLEDPETGLDELARVLAPDGLLAVSSPNRDAYPPGNPHHVREYLPAELEESLRRRFAHVRLLRQHAWTASAILGDEDLARGGGAELEADLFKIDAIEPGEEIFTIALCSDAELPEPGAIVALGPQIDQRAAAAERQVHAERHRLIEKLEDSRQVLSAEQQIAELPGLYADREELAAIKSSLSWRLTVPLRRLKRASRMLAVGLRRRLKLLLLSLANRREGGPS